MCGLAVALLAAWTLRLDIPALPEGDHRRDDEGQLERDEQDAQDPEYVGAERGVGETGLVAIEPGGRGDSAEDREDDRERADQRQDAARPAGDEQREHEVDRDEGDLD